MRCKFKVVVHKAQYCPYYPYTPIPNKDEITRNSASLGAYMELGGLWVVVVLGSIHGCCPGTLFTGTDGSADEDNICVQLLLLQIG